MKPQERAAMVAAIETIVYLKKIVGTIVEYTDTTGNTLRALHAALEAPEPEIDEWGTKITPELGKYLYDKHIGSLAQPAKLDGMKNE